MSDTLTYVLSCLRRASDNAYSWSLTPSEAGALVAEIQRLRRERPAVVAYLRAPGTSCDTGVLSEAIERGEHLKEKK